MTTIDRIAKTEDERLATYCQRRNLTQLKAFYAPANFLLRKVSYESGKVYWTLYTDEEKRHVLCSDGHIRDISSRLLEDQDYRITDFMQVIAMYDKYVYNVERNPHMENRNFQVCSVYANEIDEMYSRDDELKFLVGRKIDKIYIDDDAQEWVKFVEDNGAEIVYYCDGDCCSESWVYSIIGADSLAFGPVVDVEATEMGIKVPDTRSRQEYDDIYKYTIRTAMGFCDIEFRNSSNGYYGGNMKLRVSWPASINWKLVDSDYIA